MVAALTNESATSKSVYFSLCTSEMIYITHLLAKEPEKLAGPLLADTYVTLLKGRNAWYGHKLAKGELTLEMGDSIKGKGTIQGVSAVNAFYELLSQGSLSVTHPETKKHVAPVELCPILKTLYKILIKRLKCSWIFFLNSKKNSKNYQLFPFLVLSVAFTAALMCLFLLHLQGAWYQFNSPGDTR
jgi:glycerol-3-phosphate dehydrogenase